MNNQSETSHLSYRASPQAALVIFLLSLFCQWLNWFAFEKIGYDWRYTLITPVILCVMYHFVQTDAGRNGNFSRRFFFIFSVIAPLIFGIVLTVLMFLSNPQMSVFNPEEDYAGTVAEAIATYAGRFVVTSFYMLVFAAADIPLLNASDRKGKEE